MNSMLECARAKFRHRFPGCSLSPMCWFCVSVSCFGILHGFYFPAWPASGTLRLLPLCASWVSALILSNLTILSQEARGQLQGCVKNGWEMILKATTLKSNIVTSLLNVDRALTHLEGMVDTHCLRFWNSGNPAKYFMSLKSSLFIFTSQDNKTVLVGKEKTTRRQSAVLLCEWCSRAQNWSLQLCKTSFLHFIQVGWV